MQKTADFQKTAGRYLLIIIFVLAGAFCLAGCRTGDKDGDNSFLASDEKDKTTKDGQKDASQKDPYEPGDSINTDTGPRDNELKETGSGNIDQGGNYPEESDTPSHTFINPEGTCLADRINTPEGYERIPSYEHELANFLRSLPLKPDKSKVMLYNGNAKADQSSHAAVFDLDVGSRDLQQCADSIIRVYAEYFWSVNEYDRISFHLTNGFLMEYTKWRDGNRLKVEGNDVSWVRTADYDASYESFRKYLDMVYAYAGTLSLKQESEKISLDMLKPGDMLLEGGSPGHCILIVDMAADSDGKRCFLLAQGYMPAQDFHVINNPHHPEDPWYYEDEFTFPFITPAWTFDEGSLARWAEFPMGKFPSETHSSGNYPPDNETANADSGVNSVTLLAAGDNLIHIEVVKSGKRSDGSLNYDHLYSNVKDMISEADIAVVNQETILGGDDFPYSGYPSFNSPYEIGDALIEAGFDVVLHATNHTLDMGVKGVQNTLEYWESHPAITVLGINKSKEDQNRIQVIEKNGIKIAMLNYTFGLNGRKVPEDKPYLVNMLSKDKMSKDIKKARELADFVIVFPHWGTEYTYEPIKSQRDLTDFFYKQGVDLVIGAHPHVLEPVEWIEEEPGRRMLVYYSLGNFMSYQKEAPRMLGGIARVTITRDSGGTYISDADITPIVTHYEHGPADYNYAIYPLSEYTPELANVHGVSDIARQGRLTYEETYNLAREVLGSWFKQ